MQRAAHSLSLCKNKLFNSLRSLRPSRSLRYLPLLLLLTLLPACARPSRANNTLREDQQRLEQEIVNLKREKATDAATIAELQNKVGTIPTSATGSSI